LALVCAGLLVDAALVTVSREPRPTAATAF